MFLGGLLLIAASEVLTGINAMIDEQTKTNATLTEIANRGKPAKPPDAPAPSPRFTTDEERWRQAGRS